MYHNFRQLPHFLVTFLVNVQWLRQLWQNTNSSLRGYKMPSGLLWVPRSWGSVSLLGMIGLSMHVVMNDSTTLRLVSQSFASPVSVTLNTMQTETGTPLSDEPLLLEKICEN